MPDPTATSSTNWVEQPAVKHPPGVQSAPVSTLTPSDTKSSSRIELISPEPVHRGEQLTVAFRWVGPQEANLFEVYLAVASADSCLEGPLQYSRHLDSGKWNLNYFIGPWYASARAEDMDITVEAPGLPAQFRICIAPLGQGERAWEEFLFEWLR